MCSLQFNTNTRARPGYAGPRPSGAPQFSPTPDTASGRQLVVQSAEQVCGCPAWSPVPPPYLFFILHIIYDLCFWITIWSKIRLWEMWFIFIDILLVLWGKKKMVGLTDNILGLWIQPLIRLLMFMKKYGCQINCTLKVMYSLGRFATQAEKERISNAF